MQSLCLTFTRHQQKKLLIKPITAQDNIYTPLNACLSMEKTTQKVNIFRNQLSPTRMTFLVSFVNKLTMENRNLFASVLATSCIYLG